MANRILSCLLPEELCRESTTDAPLRSLCRCLYWRHSALVRELMKTEMNGKSTPDPIFYISIPPSLALVDSDILFSSIVHMQIGWDIRHFVAARPVWTFG